MDILNRLENEAIFIIREVMGQFNKPALLFSGGKDSIVLLHLCRKAFLPAKIPFPIVHIDTGHNFLETIELRDTLAKRYQVNLKIAYVQDSINNGTAREETGKNASRNSLQTVTLLETIEELQLDACMGGARRDEEKARAKERVFSVRDSFGQWNEKLQRPEVFDMLNGKIHQGENVRVFPISNWTELDVWEYIKKENLEIPSIYFAHSRVVYQRQGQWMPVNNFNPVEPNQKEVKKVRFRTVGDMSCTEATELSDVIEEIRASTFSERGARMDDKRSEGAMEERKKVGYF
jgi:sulfate adenylyltransferase subunit 2